jgi:hypothetical protein
VPRQLATVAIGEINSSTPRIPLELATLQRSGLQPKPTAC